MAMFLISEGVFFFMLIAAFVYFRGPASPAAGNLSLGATAIYTLCLAASSFTMWRASATSQRETLTGLRGWIAGTLALGCIFFAGQTSEYARLLHKNITISQGLFGATFFTLTGFHGLHVLFGILLLAVLLYIATAQNPPERRSAAVQTVALYWYFVDLVWIAIFAIVYLWTLL